MATEDRKAQLSFAVDGSQVKPGLEQIKQDVRNAAKDIAAAGEAAGKGIQKIGEGADPAAKDVERSTRSIINSIQRTTAVAEAGATGTRKYFEAMASQRGVSLQAIEPSLRALDAVKAKQDLAAAAARSAAPAFEDLGMSSKALAAATRGLPAQFTDIVVSLQGGQRPMTVLMQQGGQLKDMFGGIGPAARAMGGYVAGLINPFTLAAAAIGTMYIAYAQGASESEKFTRTLLETGNQVGLTAGQMTGMARSVDGLVGTQARASSVLAQFAQTTKVSKDSFVDLTAAAIAWEKATGTAAEDTVKAFEEIGKAPVEATLKLNDGMNFLTASVYNQILALEKQGKAAEAGALAQKTYAEALATRSPQIEASLGGLEKAWMGVRSVAAEAWDAMLGIGRQATLEDRISAQAATVQALDAKLLDQVARGRPAGTIQALQKKLNAAAQEQARLENEYFGEAQKAREDADRKTALDQATKLNTYMSDMTYASKTSQRVKETEEEKKKFAGLIKNLQEGSSEYEKLYAKHKENLKGIDDKFKEKAATGGVTGGSLNELAQLAAKTRAERERTDALAQTVYQTTQLNEGERQALTYAEKLKTATDAKTKASLQSAKAAAEELGVLIRANDLQEEFLKTREKEYQDRQRDIAGINDKAIAVEDEVAMYGLGKAAVEAMELARLQEQRAVLAGFEGSERLVEQIDKEIEARKRLQATLAEKGILDAQKKAVEEATREWRRASDQIEQSLTDALLRGFESGKSFAENFRDTLKNMFATLVLRPLIQPIAQGAAAAFVGAPAAQGSGGGLLSSLVSQFGSKALTAELSSAGSYVYNLFSGPVTSVGNGVTIGGAGNAFGSLDLFTNSMGTSAAQPGAMGAVSSNGGISGLAAAGYGIAGSYLGGALFGNKGQSSTGGGLGAAAGATYGATYGAYGGPIGAAIGAVAGAALGSIIGSAESRKGGFYMWDAGSQTPARQGWKDGDPGAEVDKYVGDIINGAVKSINSAFEGVGSSAQLTFFSARAETSEKGRGGTSSGGSLTGLSGADRDFGTQKKGQGYGERSGDMEEMLAWLTTDVYQTIIQAWQAGADEFPDIIRNMVAGVDADALSSEQAQALVAQVQQTIAGVNQLREGLNGLPFKNLRDLSFDATAALVELTSAVGGLEGLAALQQSYFENFYSEEEKRAQAMSNMEVALGAVGLAVPKTIEAYRELVDAQDMTTDSGRKAYLALLQTSDAFATYTRALEEQAQASRQSAMGLYDSLLGNVRAAYDRESALLQDRINKAESYFRSLGNYLDSLSLGNLSPLDNGQKLALARKQYEDTLAKARAGDTDAQGQLTSAAQEFLEASRNWNASSGDYAADFAKVQADLVTARAAASSQLTLAKQQLTALQRQADGILSLDETMMTLADAVLAYLKAFGDGRNYMTLNPDVLAAFKADSGGMSMAEFARFHFENYGFAEQRAGAPVAQASDAQRYLNSNPDVYQAYLREKEAGYAGSAADFARMHFEKYGRKEGRSFAIGTNFVPYDMTAQIHQGERIIPAADNRALMAALRSSADDRGEIESLRRQLEDVTRQLAEVVRMQGAQIAQQAAIADQDERLMSEQTEEIRRGKSRLLPA